MLLVFGVGLAFAEVYDKYTGKDSTGSQYFLPIEGVHACNDTDDCGNDGLYIRVHAYQGGADALLTYRDKEIGDKSSADDEEEKFEYIGRRKGCIVDTD